MPASFCILQWSSARSSALRTPSCLLCRVDKHPLVVDCVQRSASRKPSQVGLSSPATRAAGAVAMAPRKPLRHQCLARDLPCTESGPDAPSPTSSCESSPDPAGPIGAPFVPDELNPCIAPNHCRVQKPLRSVRIRSTTLVRLHGFVLLPSGILVAGTGNAMI